MLWAMSHGSRFISMLYNLIDSQHTLGARHPSKSPRSRTEDVGLERCVRRNHFLEHTWCTHLFLPLSDSLSLSLSLPLPTLTPFLCLPLLLTPSSPLTPHSSLLLPSRTQTPHSSLLKPLLSTLVSWLQQMAFLWINDVYDDSSTSPD